MSRRAAYRCEYCLAPERFSPDPFCLDHISPRSAGGGNTRGNLAYSCQGCNSHKYTSTEATDPATGERVPLFNPRRQWWGDHFVWSVDFGAVVGLTPTGRATVDKLRMNREGLLNLRRALRAAGEHPPVVPTRPPADGADGSNAVAGLGPSRHPVTPDGRYFVVRGRLWRRSDPALPEGERQRLVNDLMEARSDVGRATRAGDADAERAARRRVHAAKVALGERGPVWWSDGAADCNRRMARNTPYADWFAAVERGDDAPAEGDATAGG